MQFEKAVRGILCGGILLGAAVACGGVAERPLRGPFPLLVTPWTADAPRAPSRRCASSAARSRGARA